MSNTITALRNFAARLAGATQTARDEIAAMRARIAAIPKQLLAVTSAPLPMNEIDERVRTEAVPARAAAWLEAHGRGLFFTAATGQHALAMYAQGGRTKLPDGVTQDPFGALCVAHPDLAAQLLTGLVAAVPFEAGLPSAERPAIIAGLERELAELSAAEEQAIDEAEAAGLVIQHRPEVVQRRQQEARRAELEEQRVADRARRQQAVDAAAADRSRTVRSSYLDDVTAGKPTV